MQVNSIGIRPYSQNFNGGALAKIGDFRRKFFSINDNSSDAPVVFEKNNNLCQDIFDGTTLRPEVAKKLQKMAEIYRFCLMGKPKPVDVYIVGSMASYNYKPSSDIDLKLILDYSKLIDIKDKKQVKLLEDDLYKTFVLFQVAHFDDINGHRIEVGTSPTTKIHPSGIYSLKQNKWLKSPTRSVSQVKLDQIPETALYKHYKNELSEAIEAKDRLRLAKLIRELQALRIKALKTNNEHSYGNLLFKTLRNEEYDNGISLFNKAIRIMLGFE